jgi:hypothetical protein
MTTTMAAAVVVKNVVVGGDVQTGHVDSANSQAMKTMKTIVVDGAI